jgi:hypothetical protein
MQPIGGGSSSVLPLALFGGGPLFFGFDAHPKWTTWLVSPSTIPVSGYFWITESEFFLNGEGYTFGSLRWIVKGMKVPCPAP